MAGFKLIKDLEKTLNILALSDIHRRYSVNDIQRLIIPPLKLKQYRIYESKEIPLCFLSWAFLDAIASEGFVNDTRQIQANDWNKGKLVWLMDIICPYGGIAQALERLDNERKRYNKGKGVLGKPKLKMKVDTFFYKRMNRRNPVRIKNLKGKTDDK